MKTKVLLYSGGVDSFILSRLWKPDIKLYFDLGTQQSEAEKALLDSDVIVKRLPLAEFIQDDGLNTIPLRNLIFVTLALNYGDIIAFGGLKSDLHMDTKPEFAKDCTKLFNSVLGKESKDCAVEVIAPAGNLTKTELIFKFLQDGGTIEELTSRSWSCYNPIEGQPCGKCQACRAREKAIDEATRLFYGANFNSL